MSMWVKRLLHVVPPPSHPNDTGDVKAWRSAETELGIKFPSDFKELTTHYGAGQWQAFWYLLNPFTKNCYLNLIRQTKNEMDCILKADRCSRESFPSMWPYPIFPEPGGILPWASTDNGGRFYWITSGDEGNWSTLYYPDRSFDFKIYNMSCSELLYGAVTGEIPVFNQVFEIDHEYGRADAFSPFDHTSNL